MTVTKAISAATANALLLCACASLRRDCTCVCVRAVAGAAAPQPERFKTGAGKELKMIAAELHETESIFGGLWPELSRLGKLLAGATESSPPPTLHSLPQEPETVIHLFPPGCFPKGKPLASLLEADTDAGS